MKQLATASLLGLLALMQPTIAAPHNFKPHHANTCVSNGRLYHSGTSYLMSGKSYIIHCGRDSTSEAFKSLELPSGGFSACSESCGLAFDCGGFSFTGAAESGVCHLKNGLGDLTGAVGDCVTGLLDPDGNGIEPEPWTAPEPWLPPQPEPVPTIYPGSGGYGSTSLTVSSPVASSYGSVPSSPASVASSYVSGNTGYPSSAPAVSSPSLSLPAYTSPVVIPTSAIAPIPSALDQCQQTVKDSGAIYRGGNGSPYELGCGEDHYGGDLTAVGSDTFLGCIDICNANLECIGYSYLGRNCYLKKYLNAGNTNPAVNFALNLDRNITAKPLPSSTSAAATSPMGTAAAAPGSCGYIAANGTNTYTNSDNAQYTIQCGTDHNGGDIGAVGAKDFVGCMDACDKKDKCIAFSWVGGNGPGTCYLKGTVTDIEHDVYVDYAYKKTPTDIPAPSSSSAASYGGESTSAGVIGSLAPPATSVSLSSSYPSVSPVSSYASSDSDGVVTVTVTSYTGSATASSTSTNRIIHPQPSPKFPWPLWPNPTKLPPTKAPHHHPPPVYNPLPLPEPALATSYTSQANIRTAWVTSASPTPFVPDVPRPNSPDGPPSHPFGVPPLDQPNGLRPNPYGVPRIPFYGEPPFFPPNVRRSVPDEPTKTYTKKPLEPTSVGDSAYCDQLRSQKPKKLHVEVTHGDYKFNNMWVRDPTRGQYRSLPLPHSSLHPKSSHT